MPLFLIPEVPLETPGNFIGGHSGGVGPEWGSQLSSNELYLDIWDYHAGNSSEWYDGWYTAVVGQIDGSDRLFYKTLIKLNYDSAVNLPTTLLTAFATLVCLF